MTWAKKGPSRSGRTRMSADQGGDRREAELRSPLRRKRRDPRGDADALADDPADHDDR